MLASPSLLAALFPRLVPLGQHLKEFLRQLAVAAGKLADITAQRIAGSGKVWLVDQPKQAARRPPECIGEAPEGVERGLAGAGLEVGDRGRRHLGAVGQYALAIAAKVTGGAKPLLEDVGWGFFSVFFAHVYLGMVDLTGLWEAMY